MANQIKTRKPISEWEHWVKAQGDARLSGLATYQGVTEQGEHIWTMRADREDRFDDAYDAAAGLTAALGIEIAVI